MLRGIETKKKAQARGGWFLRMRVWPKYWLKIEGSVCLLFVVDRCSQAATYLHLEKANEPFFPAFYSLIFLAPVRETKVQAQAAITRTGTGSG